jgi:hypothetical protein
MNATLVNFAAGETSPRSRGRFDAPWYNSAARKLLNFIPEIPGPARFRSAFKHAAVTRGGGVARLIPFQVNNSRAFMLEFTDGKMRVYKNEALLTKSRTTVTAATRANPCVITVADTSLLANGDEVIITGLVGMDQLNGRQVKLAGSSGSTFQLVDPVTGSSIDSTAFNAYVSGGTLAEVYEIDSPYLAADLDDLQWAQNNTNLYITHPRYKPRKVTVDSGDNFTLATFTRTTDPFASRFSVLNITGISHGTAAVIHFAAGSTFDGSTLYDMAAVLGATQINGHSYYLEHPIFALGGGGGSDVTAYLKNADGTYVDSSAWGAWTSGGTATPQSENPIGVAFHESRLWYLGTSQRPNSIFGSRAPDDSGNPRYDDFTGGTTDEDACFFALAPVSGAVDYIAWGRATAKYLFIGTFGGPFRVSGSGLDEPITPASINVRQFDTFGCEEVMPAGGGSRVFFIQRGGTTLRTARYNADLQDYDTYDLCLNAEHIPNASRLRRVLFQAGRPDIVWVIREDGILAGVTVHNTENVTGWHRQQAGGVDAKIIDGACLQRTDKDDQLWAIVSRTIGGRTVHTAEFLADDPFFPDFEDYYGLGDIQAEDQTLFEGALYRRQEEYIHVDGACTYNGSDRGATAAATLTPAAVTGLGVHFVASAAVFQASDVGNELWKKPARDTGLGQGRATITQYVSATEVIADITVAFDAATAVAAGEWHIATETIYGLWMYEGERMAVVTDGAVYSDGQTAEYPTVTVTGGAITLADPAAVVHVGFPYKGFIQTQNLEMGGRTGPAQDKPRNISDLYIRFLNSLGAEYGTDPYELEAVSDEPGAADRPAPVFSGIKRCPYPRDKWSGDDSGFEKHVFIQQNLPLPCVVQNIDIRYSTGDDD